MTAKDAPKIEFPCQNYPIKVIGYNAEGFRDLVVEMMQKHAPDLDMAKVTEQSSRNGQFISIRFNITATGVSQLRSLHEDLMATGRVKMVL
jgi:hypothetical protein